MNFVHDLKSYVLAHSPEALKKKVDAGAGLLRFRLNDQPVELIFKQDFFSSALDMLAHKKEDQA